MAVRELQIWELDSIDGAWVRNGVGTGSIDFTFWFGLELRLRFEIEMVMQEEGDRDCGFSW